MIEIREFLTDEGRNPFRTWMKSLKDKEIKARVRTRLTRVALGNLGDSKSLSSGLYEIRFTIGAGYRIYYCMDGEAIVILLCAGDKSSQTKDIERARGYLDSYKRRIK